MTKIYGRRNTLDMLDIHNLQAIITRRVQEYGLSVRFDPDAPTAYTTSTREIVLPTMKPPLTADDGKVTYYLTIHECGHHLRNEVFDILKNAKLQPNHPLHAIYNILEDECQEKQIGRRYAGDKKLLGEGFGIMMERQYEKHREYFQAEDLSEDSIKAAATLLTTALARQTWDKLSTSGVNKAVSIVPESVLSLRETLESEGWADKIAANETVTEVWDTACDLFKRLYEPDDEDKKEQFNQDVEALREAGKADASPDKESEESVQQAADRTWDREGEESESKSAYTEIPWTEFILSDHGQEGGAPAGVDWTGKDYQADIGIMPPNEINVVECKDKGDRGLYRDNLQARELANQVRRYLLALRKTKVKADKTHGRFDKRGIVKLGYPPIDGGEWNRRIFYQMDKRLIPDTAVGILVDWSGSMLGSKMVNAAQGAARINYVFNKILNLPTCIAAFSTSSTQCDIGLIKDWRDRQITDQQIAGKFADFRNYTGGNNDSDAILWMGRQLMQRKEERKIMVVLTDGMPTCMWEGCPHDNLKHAVKSCEKYFDVICLGIECDHVELFYNNYKVIQDSSEINSALLSLLKKQLVKYTRRVMK